MLINVCIGEAGGVVIVTDHPPPATYPHLPPTYPPTFYITHDTFNF